MPCPFFEPVAIASQPVSINGRLPLIDEYTGICRATLNPSPAPEKLLHRCCNHGYSQGCCEFFPQHSDCASLRYSVLTRSSISLDIVCIEERDYAPVRSHRLQYFISTGLIEGDSSDVCRTTQVLAFCRSYLLRCPEDSGS